jgi:hypothetical protein
MLFASALNWVHSARSAAKSNVGSLCSKFLQDNSDLTVTAGGQSVAA